MTEHARSSPNPRKLSKQEVQRLADAVRARLSAFLDQQYQGDSVLAMTKRLGINGPTLAQWKGVANPRASAGRGNKASGRSRDPGQRRRAPERLGVGNLLQLAKNGGLSLDWLVTGEGNQLRGTSRPRVTLEDELLAQVRAALGESNDTLLPTGPELLKATITAARNTRDQRRQEREKRLREVDALLHATMKEARLDPSSGAAQLLLATVRSRIGTIL